MPQHIDVRRDSCDAADACGHSDDDLMRRVQADDDTDAFGELYERYWRRAFGFARGLCHSDERAEDATQEAFLCLWRARATYEPCGEMQRWIFGLTRNRAVDIYRRNWRADGLRASEVYLETFPAAGCLEDEAVAREEGERVRSSLRQLPEQQREVLVLAYFAGLSHSEIADRLEVPLGTVKGRMRLGLSKARWGIERPVDRCVRAPA